MQPQQSISRRQFVKVATAGLAGSSVAILLAACQTPVPPAATSKPAPTQAAQPPAAAPAATQAPAATAAQAAPRRGGTLVLAQAGDPNPVPGNTDGSQGSLLSGLVYQGLVYVDKDRKPKPQLAESWEASPDALQYTFKLRKGVKWQDGRDFTASDVLFTYQNITPTFAASAANAFQTILQKVEAPDPSTIKLTLARKYGPFLSFLNVPIVPEHLYAGTDFASNPHNRMPVGTGPFRLTRWTPAEGMYFQRNENYWKPGQPYLDQVVIKIIPQGASRIAALLAGEVDYLPYTEVVPQDFVTIKDDPNLQWATGLTSQAQVYVTLNHDQEPMNNKQFRQALLMAIDRETMNKQITHGLDAPASSPFHNSITWAQNPETNLLKLYPFDPGRANQLLDQAGFPRGADGNRTRPLRFYVESGRPNFDTIAQYVQQQWRAISVPVTPQRLDRNVMQNLVFIKRDFDLNMNESNSGGDPEIGLARFYMCESIRPVPSTNGAGYCRPEVDRLFEEASEPNDPAQRGPTYAQALKFLTDDVPYLWLIDRQDHSVASAKFELKSTLWKEGLVYDQLSGVYLNA